MSHTFEPVLRAAVPRATAAMVRRFGFDVGEDAVSDAVVVALRTWPDRGVPTDAAAWLVTVAGRKALDRLRRDATLARKTQSMQEMAAREDAASPPVVDYDDRLALLFTCCHPALAPPARVALTLRAVAGLTTAEVARAFLVEEATLAQRIVRAKRKIRDAHIRFAVPPPERLAERLDPVLTVVYLVFNEGYAATTGPGLVRVDCCAEATRLGRLLYELLPADAEVAGLLALMLFHDARRAGRSGPDGVLVPLESQDRSRWDRAQIAEADGVLEAALRRRRPGRYQVQAAIAGLHAQAPRAADTDWQQIAALYAQLRALDPSPVVALNHAVAVAMSDGPAAGLVRIAALGDALDGYHLFHAARADLLRRAGERSQAATAYRRARALATNPSERDYLQRRLAEVAGG